MLTWAVVLTMLLSVTAVADWSSEVRACDKALSDSQNLVFEQGKLIVMYKDRDVLQDALIESQGKRLESPLHDPVKVAVVTTVAVIVLEVLTGRLK